MRACEVCGKPLKTGKRFCSKKCYGKRIRGENNPAKRPEVREKQREIAKNQWKDPEVKEKMRKSIKEAMNRPEVKAKISGENNPAKRPEVRRKMKEAKNRPEVKAKIMGENNPMKRPEVKAKIMGENNPVKRPEVREKLSRSIKEAMKRPEVREKYREIAKNQWKDPEFRERMSGENNPNWKGGISTEPYCSIFKMPLKERIREKYGRKCFLCGVKENGKRLCIHHIDYNKKHCTPDNLIPLCVSCNSKVNFNREFWQNYFSSSLELREGFV